MSNIAVTTTTSEIYSQAQAALSTFNRRLLRQRNPEAARPIVVEFEDAMNGLSGDITNLPPDDVTAIQRQCAETVDRARNLSIPVSLHASLLPTTTETRGPIYKTGKKLYPLTTSVEMPTSVQTEVSATPVASTPQVVEDSDEEIIDPIFDEIDAEAAEDDPYTLALNQTETVEIIPPALLTAAETAAANTSGLEAGLVSMSTNPLSSLIENTRNLVLSYTANNFAGLNTALAVVASDPSLNVEYETLREALGGGDGLSGSVSQLDNFEDHTDRLSGLKLDSDSDNAEPDDNTVVENLQFNDVAANTFTKITEFDARKFRSARYMVQATSGREHQFSEIYLIHDNHHPYIRQVSSLYTQDPFMTFSASLVNGKLALLVTCERGNTDFVIHGTRMRIARASRSYSKMSQTKIILNHETLREYLDDGVDYVKQQSGSVFNSKPIAELAREVRGMITDLTAPTFPGMSEANRKAKVLSWATAINNRTETIQASIDADYNAFVEIGKRAEALTIAYSLATGYADAAARPLLDLTLNNPIRTALSQSLEDIQ